MLKVNRFTGEVDLNLFPEEPKKLTLSELRDQIPIMVERELRTQLAAHQHREFVAAIHEHSGGGLTMLKF
jgi:hypothetical protein